MSSTAQGTPRTFSPLVPGDRVVIVGAGPAGLTAAYQLAKTGVKAIVLEADDIVGGISRTAQYKGFRFDIGGHRFFTKIEPVQALWDEVLGAEFISVPRLSRIHYNGRFFDYPLKAANALRGLGSRRQFSRIVFRASTTMATSRRSTESPPTFWSEEHLASLSASPDCEADWLTTVATWPSNSVDLLCAHAPSGWSGRTCPASCRAETDGTLVPSSEGWGNAGMGSPTAFLTLSILEFPSDAAVCSLSDILETGDVPPRFYLSGLACRGILRRAAKRGRQLPPSLLTALEHAAQTTTKDRQAT